MFQCESILDTLSMTPKFKIVMSKDKTGPCGKVLNWGRAKYKIIGQELGRVNWN